MSPAGREVDLTSMILDAADGRFPPVDGGWSRTRPWHRGLEGAVAFTGHAVLALGADVSDAEVDAAGVNGFGGAHDPRATAGFAGTGRIGILDVLMVARGTGTNDQAPPLVQRPDLREHPRVRHAALTREQISVLGFDDPSDTSLVTLGRGIAGLPELGMELMGSGSEGVAIDPTSPPRAAGRATALLRGALAAVAERSVVLASVSPGNARSLRLFLRAGFTPIGSVQLWNPERSGARTQGRAR